MIRVSDCPQLLSTLLSPVLLLAAMSTASASSCPELAGHYLCDYGASQEELVITEHDYMGQPAFKIGDEVIVADNKPHALGDSGGVKQDEYQAWCESGRLIEHHTAQFINKKKEVVGYLDTTTTTWRSAEGHMMTKVRGEVSQDTLGHQEINDEFSCAPIESIDLN